MLHLQYIHVILLTSECSGGSVQNDYDLDRTTDGDEAKGDMNNSGKLK